MSYGEEVFFSDRRSKSVSYGGLRSVRHREYVIAVIISVIFSILFRSIHISSDLE